MYGISAFCQVHAQWDTTSALHGPPWKENKMEKEQQWSALCLECTPYVSLRHPHATLTRNRNTFAHRKTHRETMQPHVSTDEHTHLHTSHKQMPGLAFRLCRSLAWPTEQNSSSTWLHLIFDNIVKTYWINIQIHIHIDPGSCSNKYLTRHWHFLRFDAPEYTWTRKGAGEMLCLCLMLSIPLPQFS